MAEQYRLVYLPVAKQDMLDIMRYISHELSNPSAAAKLAEEMIEAADKLTTFPYAHEAYQPIRALKHEYRKLLVQNYIMFYWVDNENMTITISRVIYARRNFINSSQCKVIIQEVKL